MENFMKKLMLSVAIASALGLTGCGGGDTVAEVKADVIKSGQAQLPLSRISFDPANAVVPVPNDLLFSGTTDGTLKMPGETVEAGTAINYYDPQTTLGALDGWSTVAPMAINVKMASGVSLEATSVSQPGAVRIFEATLGGPLSPDSECKATPAITACKMGDELTFGVDFVTTVSGDNIVMVPIKPFKASQGYIVAVTNLVVDSNGNNIAPSSPYESVRLDITTLPLPLPSQLGLQTLINSYENGLSDAGVNKDTLVYSAAFTTQSTHNVFDVSKLIMLTQSPVLTPFANSTFNAGQLLAGAGAIDLTTPAGQQVFGGAARADIYGSVLNTAHYLDIPTAENCQLTVEMPTPTPINCAALFSNFQAMGDSPITVLGALQSGVLSMASFGEQYAAQAPAFGRGAFENNPANLVGMNFTIDVDGNKVALDRARHLTKFNPLAKPRSVAQIPVMISVPNLTQVNAIRTLQGRELLEMPANGWPVVIYQHGITTTKETLLPFAGAMADAGVVVVAIDHPLHGDRVGKLTAANGLVVPIGASDTKIPHPADATQTLTIDGQATTYLNLASLLTARDNLRQSELDLLALRLALNAMHSDPSIKINPTDVSFYGHSLGAITGVTFVANANKPVLNPATGLPLPGNPYAIKAASFLAPGGGIPGFLLESGSFGSVVQAGLTSTSTFQSLLTTAAAGQGISADQLESMKAGAPDQYKALVDAVYGPFSVQFNFAAQTVVDAGDPINYASMIAGNTDALHVMEVVGDGADNKPDQVVPNRAVGSALAGTEPLAAYMGLASITKTTTDDVGVKGIVRFTDGHHSSILTPALANGGSTVEGNTKVLLEMQKQLAVFMASQGKQVVITDTDVVKQ
jgi:Pla-1/cef family extracellular lipase